MKNNARNSRRVPFEQGLEVTALAIDETWSMRGRLSDISATGAKFRLLSQINQRIQTEEFFLVMTPDKKVIRRAKFVWEKKGLMGVKFVKAREA